MNRIISCALVATTLGSCHADLGVPDGAVISCGRGGDCPEGFICNASSNRCLPAASEDPDAPQLVAPAIVDRPLAKANVQVHVDFTVNEPLIAAPQVSFVNRGDVHTLDLVLAGSGAQPSYTYSYDVTGNEAQVESLLDVVMVDLAGNTNSTDLRASITFDFTAPTVSAGSASVRTTPPAGSPLTAVTALAQGATSTVSFTVSEPLSAPPVVSDPTQALVVPCSGTGVAFDCVLTLGANPPADGSYALSASLFDIAGNPGGGALTVPAVVIDTTPPVSASVDVPDTVVYERHPWGERATAVADQAPVPVYRVRGNAAVEADATVIVYDGPDPATSGELGRTTADAGGSFGTPSPFVLDPVDRDVVFVSVVDAAGNESDADLLAPGAQAAAVRDVAWTATLIGKVAGSTFVNPHNFAARRRFDLAERDTPTPLSAGATGIDAADGALVTTRGAGSWRRAAEDVASPDGGYIAGAYDATRGFAVRFSGGSSCSCAGLCPGTWERHFGAWQLAPGRDPESDGNPSLRRKAAMAYDQARAQVLLFGGQDGYGSAPGLNDTWLWNGTSWAKVCTSAMCAGGSPSPRYGHAMAYDPRRRRVVLFGGSAGGDETWEWDGKGWTQACIGVPCNLSKPTARQGHAMAYDSVRGQVVMVGGNSGGDETWGWDGASWTLLCPSPTCSTRPSSRFGHAVAFDTAHGELILFAGYPNSPSGPCPAHFSDTWRWNGSIWQPVTPLDPEGDSNPGPREGHLMVWDARSQRVVMSGGVEPTTTCGSICASGGDALGSLDDTWEWDGSSWRLFAAPQSLPGPRGGHVMTYDPVRRRVMLYGGSTLGSALGFCDASATYGSTETWEWDGASWRFISSTNPPARCSTGMAFDRTDNNAVVFGGQVASGVNNSTWERAGITWSNPCAACTPAARSHHALAYSPPNGRVILFGGSDSPFSALGDTYRWTGTAWASIAPANSPSPRHLHAMTTTATRAILIGGLANYFTPSIDVWEWTGANWSQITDSTQPLPVGRGAHAIAFDASRSRVFLFGGTVQTPGIPDPASCGFGYPQCGDAWEWDGANWSPVEIADLEADGDAALREGHAMAYNPPTQEVVVYGGYNGRDGTLDDTWIWDGGATSRPAHVLTLPLETAGFVGDELLTDISVAWLAGGVGYPAGAAIAGASLYVWDSDGWVSVAQGFGTESAPQEIDWRLATDPAYGAIPAVLRYRLLVGSLFELSLAAAPTARNGDSYGSVATDYVEVTVSYQRPAL